MKSDTRPCSNCSRPVEVSRGSRAARAERWQCYDCDSAERQGGAPSLALRRACAKGEPILEIPTAAALEARGAEPETEVIFRRFRPGRGDQGRPGEVIALFPMLAETRPGSCVSYLRIGQHGAADLAHVIRSTTPAPLSDPEVASLARELERIGYRLRPIQRTPHYRKLAHARAERGL